MSINLNYWTEYNMQPLTYPIGTIPPSSSSAHVPSSSSQPSSAAHSATPSSQQMTVVLPLHQSSGNTPSGTAGTSGATAVAGGHLISTDEVISMLQQQRILQVPSSSSKTNTFTFSGFNSMSS